MPQQPTDSDSAEQQLRTTKQQFGANASNYATSVVHAKGASLGRLVQLVGPQPGWQALDIASAAGHTAFAFAPFVASVVATDVTPEMLRVANDVSLERGITNVTFEQADAHALPFEDANFDLVTCRIAPHHFTDPQQFVNEAARVLRPGGVFGLVDNLSPPDPEAARWCDDFERRRDPSHVRCLPIDEWRSLLQHAGFCDITVETMRKPMDFDAWADNMSVAVDVRSELLEDLANAPAEVAAWLQPQLEPASADEASADPASADQASGEVSPSFVLTEGLFTARLPMVQPIIERA